MTSHIVAGERLKQQLERSAKIARCFIRVTDEAHKPWEAALFQGGLHEVTITVDGDDSRWWLEQLDEHAICLPGYVLSKLEVTTVETVNDQLTATIEAETVREA